MRRRIGRATALAVLAIVCSAHVGSPDAWYEGPAGPYHVLVHIETPAVVPGIAVVNVRPEAPDVERITAFVNKFDATGGVPPPDEAAPAPDNPGWYRTRLWVMSAGSNSVTVTVSGRRGTGSAVVPLVAVAGRRLGFDWRLAAPLAVVGLFLALGMFTIVGAAVRESTLAPGTEPDVPRRRGARLAIGRAGVVLALVITGTAAWWRAEDAAFARGLFQPLNARARISGDAGRADLLLTIEDSVWTKRHDVGWLRARGEGQLSELIVDHGQLMHLFLIAEDGRSAFAHLHPATTDTVTFRVALPPVPAGAYRVFADIVHASGFTQTLTAPLRVERPASEWMPGPDDSWSLGAEATDATGRANLDGGATMTWLGASAPVVARQPANLRFVVSGPRGEPSRLEPYLGMAGHAVVVRHDGKVFIHLHPLGTISTAAQARLSNATAGDSAHAMHVSRAMSDTLSFPYAFPEPGRYTVWVQVKLSGRIATGAFAVDVQDNKE